MFQLQRDCPGCILQCVCPQLAVVLNQDTITSTSPPCQTLAGIVTTTQVSQREQVTCQMLHAPQQELQTAIKLIILITAKTMITTIIITPMIIINNNTADDIDTNDNTAFQLMTSEVRAGQILSRQSSLLANG